MGNPEKMAEIGWFTLDKLPQALHSGFKKTINLYKNILSQY